MSTKWFVHFDFTSTEGPARITVPVEADDSVAAQDKAMTILESFKIGDIDGIAIQKHKGD